MFDHFELVFELSPLQVGIIKGKFQVGVLVLYLWMSLVELIAIGKLLLVLFESLLVLLHVVDYVQFLQLHAFEHVIEFVILAVYFLILLQGHSITLL